MNSMKLQLTLLLCLLSLATVLHAEQGCPPGMAPEGGQGATSCRPIPGYNQGGAAQPGGPSMAWLPRWGAIAVDAQTMLSGASHDKASRKDAEQVALKNCQDQGATQCQIISAYANGCVALAASQTAFGAASRNTIPESEQAAVAKCMDATCKVIYSKCSRPQIIR